MKLDIVNLSENIKKDAFSVIINGIHRENNFNNFIFSYGPGKKDYIFTAPMMIEGYTKSIRYYREKDLNSNNHAVKKIMEVIRTYPTLINVRETVILLDICKWKKLCEDKGITDKFIEETRKIHGDDIANEYTKFKNKKHIRLDWWFPDYYVNLEHDGTKYHNPTRDMVRDEYLRSIIPDIQIKRVKDYTDKKIINLKIILEDMIKQPKKPPLIFRYENYIYQHYLNIHSNALRILDFWHYKKNIPYGEIYNTIKGKYPDDEYEVMLVEREFQKALNPYRCDKE